MSMVESSPSAYALTDLALQAAIELERLRAGGTHDADVLTNLACALQRTSTPVSPDSAFRFVEPGYYSPYERLYRSRESGQSGKVEDIQAYIERTSQALAHIGAGDAAQAADLTGFCVALHQALIQEITAEDAFVVHEWKIIGDSSPFGLGATEGSRVPKSDRPA